MYLCFASAVDLRCYVVLLCSLCYQFGRRAEEWVLAPKCCFHRVSVIQFRHIVSCHRGVLHCLFACFLKSLEERSGLCESRPAYSFLPRCCSSPKESKYDHSTYMSPKVMMGKPLHFGSQAQSAGRIQRIEPQIQDSTTPMV